MLCKVRGLLPDSVEQPFRRPGRFSNRHFPVLRKLHRVNQRLESRISLHPVKCGFMLEVRFQRMPAFSQRLVEPSHGNEVVREPVMSGRVISVECAEIDEWQDNQRVHTMVRRSPVADSARGVNSEYSDRCHGKYAPYPP